MPAYGGTDSEVEPYRGLARYILAIFQKYAICSILAYPFKPQLLKNVPNHDMVPLQRHGARLQLPARRELFLM